MIEEWKDVEGSGGKFRVSNLGRIWNNLKDYECHISVAKDGYTSVSVKYLDKKSISVHRLVALHFIPNPENKPTVNHIDANKQNNRVDNLEWATRKEQSQHAMKLRLNKTTKYCCLVKEENIVAVYDSYKEAERITGIKNGHILRCCYGELNEIKGYMFRSYDMDTKTYNKTRFDIGEVKPKGRYNRQIYCEENGKTYNSQMECANDLKIRQTVVSEKLNKNKKCKFNIYYII